ncbi:unnamed protein product [Lepeophtheirus salmonis]|uniref:(salmon louse) hypothetical protein n=1 Tax=Lepeophtheirus salmonis TaxID=72036 RepID=A0A7R8CDJ8_LEPSM|nr:unnamed protein product [Lepeophtheirus salmonis]CAF2750059.1 unnamed protein product [Lepeophtheirus salmonis]
MIDPAVKSKVSNIGLKSSAEELLARLQPIALVLYQVKKRQIHYCSSSQYLERVMRQPQKQPASGKTARSLPFQSFKLTAPVTKNMSATEWWESQAVFMGSHGSVIISAVSQLMTAVASSSGVKLVFFILWTTA